MAKRFFDILFATTALLLLWPMIGLVAALIWLIMGSPVVFRQERPGLNGIPFSLYKFRTMTDVRDTNGERLPDEFRMTGLGWWLRRLSLDELPQLWNVVRGDMSLVGPRPLLMEYLPLYSAEQARRHEVRPGITGWAQINGRNAISWEARFKLDVWYVDNHSFLLDLRILGMTLQRLIRPVGISESNGVTMSKFTGTH